jgi:multiple sugar transport system substrate-binding protein
VRFRFSFADRRRVSARIHTLDPVVMTVSRRVLMRLGGVAVAAAALPGATSCAGESESSGGEGTALTMKWWGGEARTKAYGEALAAYTKAHPSVTVTPESSGYDGYFDKLDADVASDQAPDIIQMDTALVSEYAGLGVLRPLDDYVGNQLDVSAFPDSPLAIGKVDGKLYGVPSGTGGVLVTYDATVLKTIDTAAPATDWTWADLATYATKLTKSFAGKVYGVSDGGGDDIGAFQIFLRQRGKDLFTAAGKLGYESSDLEEWLTYWDDMRKRKAAAPGEVTSAAHNDSAKNPLITGRVAMTFGSGLEISLPPLTSHDLDFVPVPSGGPSTSEGQYLSGGVLLTIYAHSDRPDDAAGVIGFFADDEQAIKIMGLTRGIPPTEKARRIAAELLGPAQQRALAATDVVAARVAAAKTVPPPTPPKGAGQVKELLFQNNLAVAFGRKTVAAAVDSFLAGATSALA